MVLFTDPKQVTNWLTPLEKVYDEEKKDRERHHSALKEAWRQQEAAVFTADDFASGLDNLKHLSKTLKSISTEREEGKQKQFDTIYDEFDVDDQTKIEQVAKENDLSIKGVDLINKFRKAGVSNEALTAIEKHGGHKDIRLKRLLGWQTVENSIATADQEIENDDTGKRQIEFDRWSKEGKVDVYFSNQIKAKLRKLGLNDKFIATHYEDVIKKYAATKGLEATLDYKNVKFTQDNEERVQSLSNLKNSTNPNIASVEIQNLIKDSIAIDPVNGRKNAVILLHRLNKAGKINSKVIADMKQGKIVSDLGDTGEKLLNEKDWKFIEQGELEYQIAEQETFNSTWGAKGSAAFTSVINNEWDQEKLNSFLRTAKSNGQEDKDWYKQLENINANRQNQTVYNDERFEVKDALVGGNVEHLKELKEGITNENLKAEIQKTIDRLETKQKEFNYSEKPITDLVGKYLELTVGTDGNYILPMGADTINNDLIRYFRKTFNAASLDKTILDPYEAAKTATTEYWERNGGTAKKYRNLNDPIEKGDLPRGKFTATHGGKFELYDAYAKRKTTRAADLFNNVNPNELNIIQNDIIQGLQKASDDTEVVGKTAVERYLNTPGAILSHSEIKAVFENNQLSEKLLTQAELLNVTPARLIKAQYEALKASNPELLRNLDESDVADFDFVNTMLYVEEVLHNTKSTDLLYLMKKQGIQNFSPKQAQRLSKVLNEVDSTINQLAVDQAEREKAIELKKAKAKARERLKMLNEQAKIEADKTNEGTQEYFRGTDDRTDKELDEQFNAQPGLF